MSILKRKSSILIISILFLVILVNVIPNSNNNIFTKGLSSVNPKVEETQGPSSSIYQEYDNYDEADEMSDVVTKVYPPAVIKIGEATNTNTAEIIPISHSYIVSDIKVDTVMKGNCKSGDIIKVKQEIGLDSSQYYKSDKKYVLFLSDFHDDPLKLSNMPYEGINPEQGSIPIINNKVQKFSGKQLIKDGITEETLVAGMKIKMKQLKHS